MRSIANCSKKNLKHIIKRRERYPLFVYIAIMLIGAILAFKGYSELESYYAGPIYRVEIPEAIAIGWDSGVNFTNMRILFVFQERPPNRTMLDILYKFKRGTGTRSIGNETFAVLLPFNATVIGGENWKVERLRKGVGGTLVYKRIYVGENSSDVFEGGVTLFLNQSIWYNYRGIYNAAVNFGVGSGALQTFMHECGVFVNTMQSAEYHVFVEIPSIINLQTIPSAHIVLSPHGNPSVLWKMPWLESITISYTALKEAEGYQMHLFYASLYLGLGIPLLVSGLGEFLKNLFLATGTHQEILMVKSPQELESMSRHHMSREDFRREEIRALFTLGLIAIFITLRYTSGLPTIIQASPFSNIPIHLILDVFILTWGLYAFFMVFASSGEILPKSFCDMCRVIAKNCLYLSFIFLIFVAIFLALANIYIVILVLMGACVIYLVGRRVAKCRRKRSKKKSVSKDHTYQ